MRRLILSFAIAVPAVAAASEHDAFFGTWGDPQQCARALVQPGGTVLAEPFEIDAQWLRQGRLWCSLRWGPIETRERGFFTGAYVQCGEDAVRGYFLGMVLHDDQLTLRWEFPHANGPLSRCPPP